jgi:hypothetical protein
MLGDCGSRDKSYAYSAYQCAGRHCKARYSTFTAGRTFFFFRVKTTLDRARESRVILHGPNHTDHFRHELSLAIPPSPAY